MLYNPFSLTNKTILVIGASVELGKLPSGSLLKINEKVLYL